MINDKAPRPAGAKAKGTPQGVADWRYLKMFGGTNPPISTDVPLQVGGGA